MLSGLKETRLDASVDFDAQAAGLDQAFATYHTLISQIAGQFGNTPVGATESIFVDMSYTTGLKLITPPEFMNALSEGADLTAQDIATVQDRIKNKQIKVLVYNVQTVTPIPQQLKDMALQNNIPIVGVSETLPLGSPTFQGWQAGQCKWLRGSEHGRQKLVEARA